MPPSVLSAETSDPGPWFKRVLAMLIVGPMVAFDPAGWAVFGPIKWALVLTLALMAVALLSRSGSVAVHRSSTYGWVVFLLWGVVVSLTAVDPLYTWIGTPDRHLGLLTWLVFAVLFFVGQSITAESSIQLIMRAASVALLAMGLYALLEWFDVAPVDLTLTTDRFGGTFGSAAYLGAACALLLPVAVGSVIDGLGSRAWRIAATFAVVLGTIAVIGSQTRAAWVGLVAAALFTLPAMWSWMRGLRWIPLLAAVIGTVILVLTPLGDRARAVFDTDDPGTRGRIDEWRVAVALVESRPLLGAGFEGHRIVFPEEVDTDYERRYTRRVMPDRAHNGALDVGVTTGIPGLLLYLAGAIFLLSRAWRGIRRGPPWLIGLAAGVVAYTVQQQFLFPLAEVDSVFWVLAGILVVATGSRTTNVEIRLPRFLSVGVGVIAAAALVFGLLDIVADRTVRAALDESAAGDHQAAIELADRASTLRPDSIRYPLVAGAVAAAAGTPDGFATAIDRLDTSLDISPRDPILRSRRAEYVLELARLTGASEHIAAAVAAWADLAEFDPNNAQFQLQYGVAAAIARDAVTAEVAWLRAEDLAPRSAAPATNLAALYLAGGQIDAASAAVKRGLEIDPSSDILADLLDQIEAAGGTTP